MSLGYLWKIQSKKQQETPKNNLQVFRQTDKEHKLCWGWELDLAQIWGRTIFRLFRKLKAVEAPMLFRKNWENLNWVALLSPI